MAVALHQWKLWCSTDARWERAWGETAPSECPVNPAHTIVADSISVLRSRRWQRVLLDPVMEPVAPGSTKVVANGRPAIEIQDGVTGWAAAQGVWPLAQTSDAKISVALSLIIKAAGTGTKVRIAARAKAHGPGEDSSAPWEDLQFLTLVVSSDVADIGKVYGGMIELDASAFDEGDALALQFGRDGNNEIGGAGDADDVSSSIQIVAVKVEGR